MQRRNNKQVFARLFARLFARVCWPAIAHAEKTRVNFRFSEKTARKFSKVLVQFAESHLANGCFDAVNCPETAAAPGHFTTRTFSRNAI